MLRLWSLALWRRGSQQTAAPVGAHIGEIAINHGIDGVLIADPSGCQNPLNGVFSGRCSQFHSG